jgi:hypothetical protein
MSMACSAHGLVQGKPQEALAAAAMSRQKRPPAGAGDELKKSVRR